MAPIVSADTDADERQAEHRVRVLPTVITPILLIVMGSTVVTTIAAMFLPLVRLIQSVSD